MGVYDDCDRCNGGTEYHFEDCSMCGEKKGVCDCCQYCQGCGNYDV